MSLQSKCLFVITIDENPTWSSWLEICSVYHSPAYSPSEKSTIVSVIALLLDFYPPIPSVTIATKIVSSISVRVVGCTRYNIMR